MIFSLGLLAAPGGVDSGLKVWLRADSGITATDGELVTHWADSSGQGNHATFDVANTYGELPPVFDAAHPGVNNRPTVRFNNQNALLLDLSWLAATDYTIFIVNARDRDGVANFYIAGDTFLADSSLVLGYEIPGLLRFSHLLRDLDANVETYTGAPIWILDTFRFSQSQGKSIYRNGRLINFNSQMQPLLANTGSTLGHWRAFNTQYWFQGDLAEVIIYDRALLKEERMAVEQELASRYSLPFGKLRTASQWATSAPIIDGLAGDAQWLETNTVPLVWAATEVGTLNVLNDEGFLYILVDETLDNFDDTDLDLPPWGDFMDFIVDVNANGVPDAYVDKEFGELRETQEVCFQLYISVDRSSVCMSTAAFYGRGFGTSEGSPVPHRIWEWALDLSELEVTSGDTVRLEVRFHSQTPAFVVSFPEDRSSNFENFIEITLAQDPKNFIFGNGFESQTLQARDED